MQRDIQRDVVAEIKYRERERDRTWFFASWSSPTELGTQYFLTSCKEVDFIINDPRRSVWKH